MNLFMQVFSFCICLHCDDMSMYLFSVFNYIGVDNYLKWYE